jgi:DNA-binding NtrC family response regulator
MPSELIRLVDLAVGALGQRNPDVQAALAALHGLRKGLLSTLSDGNPILLLDDDPDLCAFLSEALQDLGYHVAVAQTGEEALRLSESYLKKTTPFSLAILDLVVSGGSGGAEILPVLLNDNPDLRVIFSSGYPMEAAMMSVFGEASITSLDKPFTISQMYQAVESALSIKAK